MDKLKSFYKDLRNELSKVSWPDKKLVTRATFSVIIFSLLFGIYLWIVDLLITKGLGIIFNLWGR